MKKKNVLETETVAVSDLRPHPRNYRDHPDDQIDHLVESIKANGMYRNIVVARDNTILAGHGVVKAAEKIGADTVPVRRLDLDPEDPRALKILVGDNQIGRMAEDDDRKLSEMLRSVKESDAEGLLGTGFDEEKLTLLFLMTRTPEEFDASQEYLGMPEYDHQDLESYRHIIVHFKSDDDVEKFARLIGHQCTEKTRFMWFPPVEKGSTIGKYYGDDKAT